MTYFGIDICTDDEIRFPWDSLENRGECFKELFVWSIMAGVVD